ncbi:MAG TPA: hypothetical protein VJY33_05265 [Isosphaeraceae bacterium]|nr:hypothetical protein [Isosphaeraceae bacterium]
MGTGPVSACQIQIEANGPQTSGCTAKDPRNIHQVAREFESLLIEQILKSAKFGEPGADSNTASGSMMALAQENLARLISRNGGIGMAQFLEKSLHQTSAISASADSSGTTAAGGTPTTNVTQTIAGRGATAPVAKTP